MLFPLVLLLGIEGVLRLFGLGGTPSAFRRIGAMPNDPGASLFMTDNNAPRSFFFANRDRPGSLEEWPLVVPKPKGSVRVVLLGESAMKGFPEPLSLNSGAFLNAMLSQVWRDRTPEILNMGCTAIASFPVLELGLEALDYQPDLVVVYAGNNEYFGAYGVASLNRASSGPAGIRFQHWFRSTAIAQGLARLLYSSAPEGGKTLMETMMGQSFIATDDPIRGRAAGNLGAFIGEFIDHAKARGVPVVVCIPPCNERDLAPLGAPDTTGLSPADLDKVRALITKTEAALSHSPDAAIEPATEAVKLAPRHARARYLLGRAQYATGKYAAANTSFHEAISLDTMPWRPPAASIDALRKIVAEKGAILCDLEREFEAASARLERLPDGATGSIGWELMDDHVHPTLRGQDVVARSIVGAMKKVTGPAAVPADAQLADFDTYAAALGDNPYERYGVAHTVRILGNVPFIRETTPEAYARFDAICKRIESENPPDVVAAMQEWQKPETHPGAKRPISSMVARVFLRDGKPATAEPLFATAVRSVNPYSGWSVEYTYFALACKIAQKKMLDEADNAEALAAITRGLFLLGQNKGDSGFTERYVGRLYQLRGQYREAIPFLIACRSKMSGIDVVATDQALVDSYLHTGQGEQAIKLIEQGERGAGQFAAFYVKMRKSIEVPGDLAAPAPTAPPVSK